MFLRFKSLATAVTLLASLLLPSTVTAAEFNTDQRKELGTVIQEYLMKNPEVLRDVFQELERKEKAAKALGVKTAIKTMASDIFRSESDLIVGNPKGDVTIVEFFDYNCGYCKRSLPDVLKMIKTDKNVKIVLKEFPILGEGSTFAARAAIASKAQGKYWDFHLALLKNRGPVNAANVIETAQSIGLDMAKLKKDMASKEVTSVIQRNHAVARELNINGTPAFIVADNLFPGAVGFDTLADAVAKVRKNGGCTIC